MQSRQRYHIIVDAIENVGRVREQLEQSSLIDIKSWKSFPLLLNVSLTDDQAEWVRLQPHIQFVEKTQGVYLHEDESPIQYEILTNDAAQINALRLEILKHMDIVVNWYHSRPTSLFVTILMSQYVELMGLISLGGPFAIITNITANANPIREYTRVLNLQRYNWGIERITHRTNSFFENVKFTRNGTGTRVFVIDTGVQSNHDELVGRVSSTLVYDAFRDPSDPLYGEPSLLTVTENGEVVSDDHGTHVASLVAGSTVGVAPGATIVSVRAFSHFETSTTEHLLDAVDWVVQTHNANPGPSIANMSLSIEDSNIGLQRIGDIIMSALIGAGIICVVSAGNEASDAYYSSPANAGVARNLVEDNGKFYLEDTVDPLVKPIVVGASVYPHSTAFVKDKIWNKSNWGSTIDLFAPGAEIYGASLQLTNEGVDLARTGSFALKSGTSMAAPIVAGIAALHLENDPSLTHLQVRETLIAQATLNPFDAKEVEHARVDPPRYTDDGMSISVAGIENKQIYSPNRLAYAWFTNTRIEWPNQLYEFGSPESQQVLFKMTATATDYYGDVERIDFSYEPIEVHPSFNSLGFLTFYKTLDYVKNVGNITVNADTANFRVNAPAVTEDRTGTYALIANDGRIVSARRFTINVFNVPQAPRWVSPNAGNIIPQPIHKGFRFDADVFRFVASQEDGLTISYSITPAGALPPGIMFVNDPDTSTAFLRGLIGNIPYSSEPLVYEFIVRATAANGMIAERLFALTCEYVNEIHYFTPSWLSSLYDYSIDYPGVKFFGAAGAGNSYYKRIEVTNKDSDPLEYRIDFVPSIVDAPGIYNGTLPTGLGINNSGEIQGIVDPSAPLGLYFFRVRVTDLDDNEIYQDFVLRLNTSEDVLAESDQIIWVTPAGNIGNIYETFASHLYVEARNPEGTPVRYSLSPAGGILPDGMEVEPTSGLIIGLAPFVDQNIEYHFVVRATVGSRFVDREFSFTIVSQYEGASVLNFKANMFGPDRLDIRDWTVANELLPDDMIFRPKDENFGTPQYPFMYVLSGTSVVQPTQVMDYLKDYHKRMHLLFGPLAWSPAYDLNGTYIYDVIYMRVTDPLVKAGGFDSNLAEQTLTEKQKNPYDETLWNSQNQRSRYYPNSITNARNDLISKVDGRQGLGLVGEEGLPLWMRAKRAKGRPEIVGFTPAIIVAYVKAGKGQELTNKLVLAGYNREFVGREFILDRYYISDILTKVTTRFDVVNDEPTTVFDDPTIPNHQGDDLSHLVQQTLFDVKTVETGKYYKFEDDAPILADRLANPYR